MKTIDQATSRELEIEQVRRRIAQADTELIRITTQVLPCMMEKQSQRRKELERQETLARCPNDVRTWPRWRLVTDDIADLIRDLQKRLLLAETAVTACHSAMLGKVNPKHPAWGCVFAVQDASVPNQELSHGQKGHGKEKTL